VGAKIQPAVSRVTWRVAVVRWVLLAIGLGALASIYGKPASRRTLAKGASVQMSSNCDVAPPYSPMPVGSELLVDGKRDRDYDACTRSERAPWVLLDLGRPAAIEKVTVFGRAECCWANRTLPLLLEVSDDNKQFRELRRRTLPFTRDEPWIAVLGKETGRYLRLRVPPERGASEIVLTEIEVHGRWLPVTR
jgi:hypothetical protein